jgi:hypothetical protein
MASSKSQSPTKRLLQELQAYHSDPNDALVQLGPVSDDELMHWTAVMKGVQGTAYEGGFGCLSTSCEVVWDERLHAKLRGMAGPMNELWTYRIL